MQPDNPNRQSNCGGNDGKHSLIDHFDEQPSDEVLETWHMVCRQCPFEKLVRDPEAPTGSARRAAGACWHRHHHETGHDGAYACVETRHVATDGGYSTRCDICGIEHDSTEAVLECCADVLESGPDLVTDGGHELVEVPRGSLEVLIDLAKARVDNDVHKVYHESWDEETDLGYIDYTLSDAEAIVDDVQDELEDEDGPRPDGGIEPFEEALTFKPHPNELASAINGDHAVRFTYYRDRDPQVTFCIWGESTDAEWSPEGEDGDLEWTYLGISAETATTLAKRAGEVRQSLDIDGAWVYVSAYVGRSKDSEPARDAPLLDEDEQIVSDGGWIADPDAEWCPECQRERIDCAHRSADLVTDGGRERITTDDLTDEQIERVLNSSGFQRMLAYSKLADGIGVLEEEDEIYDSMVTAITNRHGSIRSESSVQEVLELFQDEVTTFTDPLLDEDEDEVAADDLEDLYVEDEP